MRPFTRTIVPSGQYQEVKKVGSRYIVSLEPSEEDKQTKSVECWECVVDSEPDIIALNADLQEYKAYVAEVKLKQAKAQKIKEIEAYDVSTAVNSFTITKDGELVTDYWIPRDIRTSLEGDVMAASSIGDTYKFDIREMGITLELNCNKFLEALSILRQYAYTAYNRTSEHMANVNNLVSIEEVSQYDITTGYPEKLTFDIDSLK